MHERPALEYTRSQHLPDIRPLSTQVSTSRRASLSWRFLSLALPNPRRGRPRRCPRRLVGACAKFETQPLSPKWYRLNITALPVSKIYRAFIYREYPICTSLILRLHAISYPLYPFNPASSPTPNLSKAASSANRAALLMRDRPDPPPSQKKIHAQRQQ